MDTSRNRINRLIRGRKRTKRRKERRRKRTELRREEIGMKRSIRGIIIIIYI